jgi:hypothetical protein
MTTPAWNDELSPEQVAAIQRERNRAMYDQAHMQALGDINRPYSGGVPGSSTHNELDWHRESARPGGAHHAAHPTGGRQADIEDAHAGHVADARADAAHVQQSSIHRQITSKPGEPPRRLITSKGG